MSIIEQSALALCLAQAPASDLALQARSAQDTLRELESSGVPEADLATLRFQCNALRWAWREAYAAERREVLG